MNIEEYFFTRDASTKDSKDLLKRINCHKNANNQYYENTKAAFDPNDFSELSNSQTLKISKLSRV